MIYTISDIHKAVELIATYLPKYKVILFDGPMGAGKTTLISSLLKFLHSNSEISSPTFSIVNEYDSSIGIVYHFDFYRIKSIEEAFDFGVEEYLYSNNYCFIEWGVKIEELLPSNRLILKIEILDEHTRKLDLIEQA